jgi:serine/threonine protein kinase
MNEQDIFLAALDIADPAQRADYLVRSCNGDPLLRQQVEGLLEAHERSGAFLDVPALKQMAGASGEGNSDGETSADLPTAQEESDLAFLQPSTSPGSLGRLGHYEVREVIGRGGCGIVLKAFDEKLERIVAIKVMAPELAATSPARKRFLREARATAAIRHENVVSIYAVEEQPLPFLVMEYIDGNTLQQRLDRTGPLDVRDVLRIGQQIASGLAAAHAKGLIHRDIKPGNILLENRTDHLKITDFGLARSADDASMTQSGVIAGTPLYMSPEQAQARDIDHRSDLFSLGSVLYVMCSGRPPFRAATSLAVLRRVVEDQPRPIQGIMPEVPAWLVAIIGRLHAKAPEDRFATAQEVGDLLGRCLSEFEQQGRMESVEQLMPWMQQPAGHEQESAQVETAKPEEPVTPAPASLPAGSRRHRWVAAAAMILVLLGGLGMTEATGLTNVRGTIIRLFSPDGTLIVEVDDPSVSVTIDGEEIVLTGTAAKEIRLKPGQYKLLATKDGNVVRRELVTVTQNGRQVVRVSKEAGPMPMEGHVETPDRRAAEWVLSIGGSVRGHQDPGRLLKPGETIPSGEWKLVMANVVGKPQATDSALAVFRGCLNLNGIYLSDTPVTDSGLAVFKECKDLMVVELNRTAITDAGLATFKDCKGLTQLSLSGTRVTDDGLVPFGDCKNLFRLLLAETTVGDSGLATFKECKQLKTLDLRATRVTDAGLAHFSGCRDLMYLHLNGLAVGDSGLAIFKDCNNLREVSLNGTQVGDKGLDHLKALKTPGVIRLRQTKVTALGVQTLASACPNLRIEWDGGVIEPTHP